MRTQYHLKYKRIKPEVINAVRKTIIEERIFKKIEMERVNILFNLKGVLCNIYKIPLDKIPQLLPTEKSDGFYNPIKRAIYINAQKLSLITFLHEFKHFLQHYFKKKNNEDIARGYSLSLFYSASPRHFKRAIRKGLILHQNEIKEED